MTDFGYASDGTPVQWTVEFEGESDERGYWQDSWGNPYEAHEVAPARVVGPGQVAVDAADLRGMVTLAKLAGWDDASPVKHVRAALADAEPAPDRSDPNASQPSAEPDRVTLPDAGSSLSGFTPAGYIGEDGLTENIARSTEKVKAWGGSTDKRTWGACPECFAATDPAETDAPHGPTLAVVVKALRRLQRNALDGRTWSLYADVADAMLREAGGDGHE